MRDVRGPSTLVSPTPISLDKFMHQPPIRGQSGLFVTGKRALTVMEYEKSDSISIVSFLGCTFSVSLKYPDRRLEHFLLLAYYNFRTLPSNYKKYSLSFYLRNKKNVAASEVVSIAGGDIYVSNTTFYNNEAEVSARNMSFASCVV